MNFRRILLAGTAVLFSTPVLAQNASTSGSDSTASASSSGGSKIAEIVVTARKRSEDILKVPVAVSALTEQDIERRGIESLDDVANFTPGVTDDQTSAAGARSDRSFQEIIIRGMTPSSITNPTATIFINGTPVTTADLLQNLDDIDHVEVLKGPQSAYFGRETFAGAINVITNAPSDTWTGHFSATLGSRATYNVSGTVSGPIIPNVLLFSLGGSYDTHDGSYRNADNPSQTLGDQSTKLAHASITFKPVDHLTVKVYSEILQDNDGPAATGLLLAGFPYGVISTPPATIAHYAQGNCTVAGYPWFCGTLPGLISSVSPAQDTTLTPAITSFLANPTGSIIKPNQIVKGFGLKRDAFHVDGSVEYVIPSLGVTLTYLTSYNHNAWSELSDLANEDDQAGGQYPGGVPYSVPLPYMVEDVDRDLSEEFRLATDQTKPYRALFGFSYVASYHDEGLGAPTPYTSIANGGTDRSETSGIFFSLAYDVFSKLTVTFDGRYQIDDERAYNGSVEAAGAKSKAFLPRVSAQYKFTPDMMAYFTFSKGINPGQFNSTYATLPAATQAELQSKGLAGNGVIVDPERLTNYELGFKGRFFDDRMTVSADVYLDDWTDQIDPISYTFGPNDPANPQNVATYMGYNPGVAYPYVGYNNSSSSRIKGVEFDSTFIPVQHVTVNFSAAYDDARYTSYICTGGCSPYSANALFGTSSLYPTFNAAGKVLPDQAPFSATVGVQYASHVALFGQTDSWFIRADFVYRDGVFVEATNDARTQDVKLVNLRAGLSWKGATVEAFVNNLFNNKSYTSAIPDYDFGGFFAPTSVMVGLPQLITAGVRLKYRF